MISGAEAFADRDQQQHRSHAPGNAEHGEKGAQLVRPDGAEDLPESIAQTLHVSFTNTRAPRREFPPQEGGDSDSGETSGKRAGERKSRRKAANVTGGRRRPYALCPHFASNAACTVSTVGFA